MSNPRQAHPPPGAPTSGCGGWRDSDNKAHNLPRCGLRCPRNLSKIFRMPAQPAVPQVAGVVGGVVAAFFLCARVASAVDIALLLHLSQATGSVELLTLTDEHWSFRYRHPPLQLITSGGGSSFVNNLDPKPLQVGSTSPLPLVVLLSYPMLALRSRPAGKGSMPRASQRA